MPRATGADLEIGTQVQPGPSVGLVDQKVC